MKRSHEIFVRKTNWLNHLSRKYQAIGVAITHDKITSNKKSFVRCAHRLMVEAPNTFRTPISFVRCCATYEANPNNPKQDIKMAKTVKKNARRPMRSSSRNFFPNS